MRGEHSWPPGVRAATSPGESVCGCLLLAPPGPSLHVREAGRWPGAQSIGGLGVKRLHSLTSPWVPDQPLHLRNDGSSHSFVPKLLGTGSSSSLVQNEKTGHPTRGQQPEGRQGAEETHVMAEGGKGGDQEGAGCR